MRPDEPGEDELLTRSLFAAALAQAFADPLNSGAPAIAEPAVLRQAWAAMVQACQPINSDALGLGELDPASVEVEPLLNWLGRCRDDRLAAHQKVFGLVLGGTCPPCETEYCHWSDPTYRAQQMADIAGFYRAFGVEPDLKQSLRCDHVTLEIGFVSFLLRKQLLANSQRRSQEAAICADALEHFLTDHLAWWLPTFAHALEQHAERSENGQCDASVQAVRELRGSAVVLRAWIAVERFACGVEPSRRVIAPPLGDRVPLTVGASDGGCETS
jgi:TorA maturation chaperone TorD